MQAQSRLPDLCREFYINDNGIKLHLKLDRPAGLNKCPLAIVLHGITGHMEERHIKAVSRGLNDSGVASMRAELYGHGQSGGDFSEHDILKWLNNVMAVTDFAKSLDFVTELYICGHSQGGLTAILAAGKRPDDFGAVIALSPALCITDGARRGKLLRTSFDPGNIPDTLELAGRRISGDYVRAARRLDQDTAIRSFKGPVLIVHGSADRTVPLEYSRAAAGKFSDAELKIIEGDTHCYDDHLSEVVAAVKAFITSVCIPPSRSRSSG